LARIAKTTEGEFFFKKLPEILMISIYRDSECAYKLGDKEERSEKHYVKLIDLKKYFIDKIEIPLPDILFPRDSSNKGSSEKKKRPSQRHRDTCRDVAQALWQTNPKLTIPQIAKKNEIVNACEGIIYTVKTIRKWIKDLNPDASPGRRKGI